MTTQRKLERFRHVARSVEGGWSYALGTDWQEASQEFMDRGLDGRPTFIQVDKNRDTDNPKWEWILGR